MPYTRTELNQMSPSQIRALRDQRKITEQDLDCWTDLAAGAVLKSKPLDEVKC